MFCLFANLLLLLLGANTTPPPPLLKSTSTLAKREVNSKLGSNCPTFTAENIVISACADQTGVATFNLEAFVDQNLSSIIISNSDLIDVLQFFKDNQLISNPNNYTTNINGEKITLQIIPKNTNACGGSIEKTITLAVIPKNIELDMSGLTFFSCEKDASGKSKFNLNLSAYSTTTNQQPIKINSVIWYPLQSGGQQLGSTSSLSQNFSYSAEQDITIYAEIHYSPKSSIGTEEFIATSGCQTNRIPISLKVKDAKSISELEGMEILSSHNSACRNSKNILLWTSKSLEGFDITWSISNDRFQFNQNDLKSPSVKINARNSTGSSQIKLKVKDECDATKDFSKSMNVSSFLYNSNFGAIVLKQPGNVLVAPDASFARYQWGYTDMTDKYNVKDIVLEGEVFQDYIAGAELDTLKKEYWVEVTQNNNCFSRVYFNTLIRSPKAPVYTGLDVAIVPNPNPGVFRLELAGDLYGKFEFQMYNSVGQLLFQTPLEKELLIQTYPTNQLALPKGLYYARIVFKNGKDETSYTQKVIIH
jgi:hypothetical protein